MNELVFNVVNINNKNKIICKNKDEIYSIFRSRCAVPITYTPNIKGMHLTIKLKEYETAFCIKIKNYINSVASLKKLLSDELGLPLIDTSENTFDILASGSITVLPCSLGNHLNIVKTFTNSNNFKYIGSTVNGEFTDELSDKADLYCIRFNNLVSPILSTTFNNSLALIYGNFGTENVISYSIETINLSQLSRPSKKKYYSSKNGDFIFRAVPNSETKVSLENGMSKVFKVPQSQEFIDFNNLKSINVLGYWEI